MEGKVTGEKIAPPLILVRASNFSPSSQPVARHTTAILASHFLHRIHPGLTLRALIKLTCTSHITSSFPSLPFHCCLRTPLLKLRRLFPPLPPAKRLPVRSEGKGEERRDAKRKPRGGQVLGKLNYLFTCEFDYCVAASGSCYIFFYLIYLWFISSHIHCYGRY